MFCIIVTVVAFFPFCFFMPAFGVHSQRTISWMRLFANITQVFNFFLLFFGAFFLAFLTYSSWRTSRMGRRRCLMRWSWSLIKAKAPRALTCWGGRELAPNGKSHEKISYFFGLPPFEAILSFIPGQPEAFLSPQRSSEDLSSPSSCKLLIRFL